MINYDARDLEIACQDLANKQWENCRIQTGFDGLFPAPGKCFAEVMAPGGPRAKIHGNSTFDALSKLYRLLTGRDPERTDERGE